MFAAARGGHAAIAKRLLLKAPVINWQNRAGETVLHAACTGVGDVEGRQEVVKLLLAQRKLFVEQVDAAGHSALDVATDGVMRTAIQDAIEVRPALCMKLGSVHSCGTQR